MLKVFQNWTLDKLSRMAYSTSTEKRDFNKIFGYDEVIPPANYWYAYERYDIVKRIINAYPSATWSMPPEVTDDTKSTEDSDFDTKWKELFKRFKISAVMKQCDKITELGCFSILIIGSNKGGLESPLQKNSKLTYLQPYGEKSIEIEAYEENQNSPRFGLPTVYEVTTEVRGQYRSVTEKKILVHHSRVLHFAEGVLDVPHIGEPMLRSIMNRVLDLQKVVGGASEMFWFNGRGGLVANADKDTVLENPEALKEEFQAFADQLTRFMTTKGIKTEVLNANVPDPEPHFKTIMSLISGATGIPQRILLGAESGELSSTQDKNNWQDRVDERRQNYSEPDMLRPLVDKLIEMGELPEVDYQVVWPKLGELDEQAAAETAQKLATALASYINSPGASHVIPEKQFVEEFLHLPYRETDLKKVGGALEEKVMRGSGDSSNETDDGLPNHAEPFEN